MTTYTHNPYAYSPMMYDTTEPLQTLDLSTTGVYPMYYDNIYTPTPSTPSHHDHHQIAPSPMPAAHYAVPIGSYPLMTWCTSCQDKTTSSADQFCSRRCSWAVSCKCPQCGRKRQSGSLYCSVGCAREASHANWCPQCAVRQLSSNNSMCNRCGYVPPIVRAVAKGEIHRLVDPSEKEYKSLLKQWKGPQQIIAVIRLAQTSAHRRAYLSYRASVDLEVQTSKCTKYLHGGEGNELRRFYPSTYRCEFGVGNGFSPCMDSMCTVCSVAQYGPTGSSMGYSNAQRTIQQSQPNRHRVSAVFVCRVVVGNAYHSQYHTEAPPAGFHSTVVTFPASPTSAVSKHPSQFFPSIVDDAVVVHREDAVDPVFLVLCA